MVTSKRKQTDWMAVCVCVWRETQKENVGDGDEEGECVVEKVS